MKINTSKQATPVNHGKPIRNQHLRRLTLFMVAMLVAVTASLVETPTADSSELAATQAEEEVRFQRPRVTVPDEGRCSDAETTYPSGLFYYEGGWIFYCVESGFTTITDERLCGDAAEATGRGIWFAERHACIDSIANTGWSCPPPLIPFKRTLAGASRETAGCYFPMMSNAISPAYIPLQASTTPVCIESAIVQEANGDASLVVGSTFRGVDDGTLYVVTTGGDCTFGCVDGFDANCDGKLGDYCASELDRHRASDVATCLQELVTDPA